MCLRTHDATMANRLISGPWDASFSTWSQVYQLSSTNTNSTTSKSMKRLGAQYGKINWCTTAKIPQSTWSKYWSSASQSNPQSESVLALLSITLSSKLRIWNTRICHRSEYTILSWVVGISGQSFYSRRRYWGTWSAVSSVLKRRSSCEESLMRLMTKKMASWLQMSFVNNSRPNSISSYLS